MDKLDGLEAEELPHMTRRIQQLIDAATRRHEADARAGSPRRDVPDTDYEQRRRTA